MTYNELGKRIRELRNERKLTLRQLAGKTGLNFTYLSKIENGRTDYSPSSESIRLLARILETDQVELLRLAGKVPPELERLAESKPAMAFFRRAQETATEDDWEVLLKYLDKRQAKKGKPI
ncbi:MAG: helix-turn-helix transcriptional regulator [Syntrophorhabdales bacterium]|jgi:transcriptional regulator with XRE-family HTH domain